MSSTTCYQDRDAIRVKALLESVQGREIRCFAVDPNITSFANLNQLLARAFQLSGEFEISYQLPQSNETGRRPDVFVSLTSDFDLDAAFLSASLPYLSLKVDPLLSPDSENADWSILDISEAPPPNNVLSSRITPTVPFHISLKHQMEKTLQQISKAFSTAPRKGPLKEHDWFQYLDCEGRLIYPEEFVTTVFHCGIEQSLRKEVWPHLLHVFPPDLTSDEKERYILMKSRVFWHLKSEWQAQDSKSTESLSHMIRKDVVRTDKACSYFEVGEDHPHIESLFNILMTYAVANPDVSYVQGMSDLASPLLVVLDDEALAYTCFCSLMYRMKSHFLLDSKSMSLKFEHLSLLLQRTDIEFYKYLVDIGAEDMFFCYRWLLLDLKREFQFSDSLSVMEVIWSTTSLSSQSISKESYNSITKTTKKEGPYFKTRSDSPLCEIALETEDEEDDDSEESFAMLSNDSNALDTSETNLIQIPDPCELGDGNPFALFVCLAMLLLHKDHCIQKQMDYNALAMYFDKLLRKHDRIKTLAKARVLYMEYLQLFSTAVKQDECSEVKEDVPSNLSWLDDKLLDIKSTQLGQCIEC
ncbi:TBC1 domain family member 25 [Exaiptasia diaphana]|uniref:Rab-GAP TBC domain-containing protein n=1 Tax=Exaiptasia diaphana TaxID=2652724 RepID=A0A913WRP5_EXADI|nr:TBC1 domain family member 25 [Exaiptasia diaphana]KXJ30197.1 TBC1 domain family member 25 [Exaiptasia diaphana]